MIVINLNDGENFSLAFASSTVLYKSEDNLDRWDVRIDSKVVSSSISPFDFLSREHSVLLRVSETNTFRVGATQSETSVLNTKNIDKH